MAAVARAGTRPEMPEYQSPCAPPPQLKKLRAEKRKRPKPPKANSQPPTPPPRPLQKNSGKKGFFSKMDGSIASFLGAPYVWGGRTRRGTDCSGFTQSVFAELGIELPRDSRGVVRSNLESRYYQKRYAGARRVIPEWFTSTIW
jgi:cell wall-associated NlpC family hydrolase